jgi:hypothetical protein
MSKESGVTHVVGSGRERLCETLRELAAGPSCRVVLKGLPGAGRATLARDAARHASQVHRGLVVEVDLSGLETTEDVLDALTVANRAATVDHPSLEHRIRYLRHLLQRCDSWLLLLNVDVAGDAVRWLVDQVDRGQGGLRLLLTAHRWSAPEHVTAVHVPPLSSQVSADVEAGFRIFWGGLPSGPWRSLVEGWSEGDRRVLVELCGGLPALLLLAARRWRMLPAKAWAGDLAGRGDLGALLGGDLAAMYAGWVSRMPDGVQRLVEALGMLPSPHRFGDVRGLLQLAAAGADPGERGQWQAAEGDLAEHLEWLEEAGFLEPEERPDGLVWRLWSPLRACNAGMPGSGFPGSSSSLQVPLRQWAAQEARRLLQAMEGPDEPQAVARSVEWIRMWASLATPPETRGRGLDDWLVCQAALASTMRRTGMEPVARDMLVSRVLALREAMVDPGVQVSWGRLLSELFFLHRIRGDRATRVSLVQAMQDLLARCRPATPECAEAVSRCGFLVAVAVFSDGFAADARSVAEEAVAAGELARRPDLSVRASMALAFLDADAGQVARAARRSRQVGQTLRALGADGEARVAEVNHALLAYQQGALDESVRLLRRTESEVRMRGDPYLSMRIRLPLARALVVLDDPQAPELLETLATEAQAMGMTAERSEALQRLGVWRLLHGQEEGLVELQGALLLERSSGRPRMLAYALQALAEGLLLMDRRREARELLQEAITHVDAGLRRLHHRELHAWLALSEASAEASRAQLEEAVGTGVADGGTPEVLRLLCALVSLARPDAGGFGPGEVDTLLGLCFGPVAPPEGFVGLSRPGWQRSISLRVAARLAWSVLETRRQEALVGSQWDPSKERLVVLGAGERVRFPGESPWLEVGRTPVLARMLACLVRLHQEHGAGAVAPVECLLQAGWPEERIQHDAAMNRFHQALSRLRRLGPGGWIQNHQGGWRLDPAVAPVAVAVP